MRPKSLVFVAFNCLLLSSLSAQSQFSSNAYLQFLSDVQDISTGQLMTDYAPSNPYYKGTNTAFSVSDYAYLDSVMLKFKLTAGETDLLRKNHFMATERLSYDCFGRAFHDIYIKDLPVMITTDAVLHALHVSYDQVLADIEITVMEPLLKNILDALRDNYMTLADQYKGLDDLMDNALKDVDLYITLARSLLAEELLEVQYADADMARVLWEAVQAEQLKSIALFAEKQRNLDFGQFIVRGHYTKEFRDPDTGEKKSLQPYFKAMMWLGRMDFYFTPPSENPYESPWPAEDILRMNLGGNLLNELLDIANVRDDLDTMDRTLEMLVGESDNLTPAELTSLTDELSIDDPSELLNPDTYKTYKNRLYHWTQASQQILSCFMFIDPFSSTPDTLPVSFRLMGQRYIIDSYIMGQLVFSNIIYQGHKEKRYMPDPLDVLFTIGNDNALPLLKKELETYHYGANLSALRYLVNSHDADFWSLSLYNAWLQAIRELNPPEDQSWMPFFMTTAAWQQQKMNTQLASWAQLRHDNLLYAKQSYSGATGCSFPHSYVEPYPEFYLQIARFAKQAGQHMSTLSSNHWIFESIIAYFNNLGRLAQQLADLAEKECLGELFSDEEKMFLKDMLFEGGMSGEPPFSGWYSELYYDPFKASEIDFPIADVHTQPTDSADAVVMKVLHVGTGKINLGVFLAPSPSDDYEMMAFVGPLMSYYEKVTWNNDRLTDERWQEMIENNALPPRPDWANIYLADAKGDRKDPGRELKSMQFNAVETISLHPESMVLRQNYPNPFNASTRIEYTLPEEADITIRIFDIQGRLVEQLINERQSQGSHSVIWNTEAPSGIYLLQLITPHSLRTQKMILTK